MKLPAQRVMKVPVVNDPVLMPVAPVVRMPILPLPVMKVTVVKDPVPVPVVPVVRMPILHGMIWAMLNKLEMRRAMLISLLNENDKAFEFSNKLQNSPSESGTANGRKPIARSTRDTARKYEITSDSR